MSYPRPAGIIAQQNREIAGGGKDSALLTRPPFLPDLCGISALAALVLMGELLALVLVLAVDGLRAFSWERLGLLSLVVQWVILPSAALLCRLRPRLSALPHTLAGALSFAVVLAVLLTVMVAQHCWRALLSQAPFDYWRFLSDCLIGAICAGVVLRYAYVQQQLYNQQQAELGARIDALQARIRPHFLFNSMNSLASLIAVDPDRAERLVEDLSALFRASLAESRLVPLGQELALARRYLEIEGLRLGDRLRTRWEVAAGLEDLQVPSLLLQPLLENAVLHGVAQLRQGGEIRIQLVSAQGSLQVSIENPVPENSEAVRHDGNGVALDNIRQRLAAYYGNRFKFSAGREGEGYRVRLQLPVTAGAPEQRQEKEAVA